MIVNVQFKNVGDMLKDIQMNLEELRLLPMPFGLIPEELISIIDNERLLPGLSYVQKISEDLPLMNETSFMMNTYEYFKNHQRVFVYEINSKVKSAGSSLIKLLMSIKKEVWTARRFHQIRYTFIQQTLANYKMQGSDQVKKLEGWYIWNVFKQLTQDIFDRAGELEYADIEANMSVQVIEKIRDTILSLGESEKGQNDNELFYKLLEFQLVAEGPDQANGNLLDQSVNASMAFDDEQINDGSAQNVSFRQMEQFVANQSEDFNNLPPLRMLIIGDDQKFNRFVQDYVRLAKTELIDVN